MCSRALYEQRSRDKIGRGSLGHTYIWLVLEHLFGGQCHWSKWHNVTRRNGTPAEAAKQMFGFVVDCTAELLGDRPGQMACRCVTTDKNDAPHIVTSIRGRVAEIYYWSGISWSRHACQERKGSTVMTKTSILWISELLSKKKKIYELWI
jgi:hypothetical protein